MRRPAQAVRRRRGFSFLLIMAAACHNEDIGGSWVIRHRSTGMIESGNLITSLHRADGLQRIKVDDGVLLWRYYGDDCVVWDRRTFYAACEDREPVLVAKGGQKLGLEGVVSEGQVFVRDGVPWRKRKIVPIELIKKRARAARPYQDSWSVAVNQSEELPVTNTEQQLGIDERDDTGRTPLMWLVVQQDAEAVEVLIRARAHVNARDESGDSALTYAVNPTKPDKRIVRALLTAGADVNATVKDSKETPLMIAVRRGHVEIVPMLIDAGANVNAKMSDGATALDIAKDKKLEPVIVALRAAGAKE